MRIAVFHDLPSGGAKRLLHQQLAFLIQHNHVDAYALSTTREEFFDIRPLVRSYYRYEWSESRVRLPALIADNTIAAIAFDLWKLFVDLRRTYRLIARDIDGRGYDVALVHHSAFTKTPWLLADLLTPSVYYCNEPRRESFEYTFRPSSAVMTRRRAARVALFEHNMTRLDVLSARAATILVANSHYTLECAKRAYGVQPLVCLPGFDRDRFTDLGRPREDTVLSVGGVHRYKGHHLVIEAISSVAQECRPALRIVADRAEPGHQDALRRLGKALHVEVQIDVSLPEDELVDAYNRARLTVCAADLEPFGLVPLESMGCGTPVVAVAEGGFRETVVDGVNGLLAPRTKGALAAAVERAMEPGLWKRLHEGARSTSSAWSLEASNAALECSLEEAASAGPRVLSTN